MIGSHRRCGFSTLLRDQPIDQSARLQRTIVIADVDERCIGLEIEHALLRGKHGDIFADDVMALAVELVRRGGVYAGLYGAGNFSR